MNTKDLEKIVNQKFSRQELIDFLSDSENDFDSLLIIYHKTDSTYGFRKLDESDMVVLTGLARIISKFLEDVEVEGILENANYEDEE